jgi:hypothetical protein
MMNGAPSCPSAFILDLYQLRLILICIIVTDKVVLLGDDPESWAAD